MLSDLGLCDWWARRGDGFPTSSKVGSGVRIPASSSDLDGFSTSEILLWLRQWLLLCLSVLPMLTVFSEALDSAVDALVFERGP